MTNREIKILPLGLLASCLVLGLCAFAEADQIGDITGLSDDALNSLVAHYDGRRNVSTSGNVVDSWTPVDANGNALNGMTVLSNQRGNGAADLITYDGFGRLTFDDTSNSLDGRYLSGQLANTGTTGFTVFWLGHYNAGAPFETSGTYVYNIGFSDISHQRDEGGGGFRVELHNGTTYAGDDITAFDGIDTLWSTVVTASSHDAYANGTNLNVTGSPVYNIRPNAGIAIGAFNVNGFDFVGDVCQLVIFASSLSDADRGLVENYLTSILEPPIIIPDSVTPTEGDYVAGGIAELAESDNLDYTMRRRNADLQSRTEFEVKSTSPTETPTTIEFTLEGSVFARGNVVQTIELFDYDAGDWELVDTSDANRAPMPDMVVTATPTGDLSRFVEAGTMSIEARIRYKSDRNRQKFASNTDQAVWTID